MPGTALDTHMHVHTHLAIAKATSARRFRFASAAGPRPCPRPRWTGSECISTCISLSYAHNVVTFSSYSCSTSSSSSSRLGALWRQLGCQQLVATCSAVDTRICGAASSCTLAALSGRTTTAQQTEQCAQPDEQLRRRHWRHAGCKVGNLAATGHRRHCSAAIGHSRWRHVAALVHVIVVDTVVVRIVWQTLQQLPTSAASSCRRLADVAQGQRDACGTRMLRRRRAQRQRDVVHAGSAAVRGAAGFAQRGRKLLADGADARGGAVAVAVAAVVGAVAGLLQLLPGLGYVLIYKREREREIEIYRRETDRLKVSLPRQTNVGSPAYWVGSAGARSAGSR